MFSVVGVHYSKVNCVEWSQNTLKLFSGDVDGIVACTEMDYTAVSQWYWGAGRDNDVAPDTMVYC